MPTRVASTAVAMGGVLAIAAPTTAANATGGVMADTTPKFFAYFKSLRPSELDEPDVELPDKKKKSFKRKSIDADVERFEDKKHRRN